MIIYNQEIHIIGKWVRVCWKVQEGVRVGEPYIQCSPLDEQISVCDAEVIAQELQEAITYYKTVAYFLR